MSPSPSHVRCHCHCLRSPPPIVVTITPSCCPHRHYVHPLTLPSISLPSQVTTADISSHCHHCSSGHHCHCSSGCCCCHLELPPLPSSLPLPFMLPLLSWVGCHCCHLKSPIVVAITPSCHPNCHHVHPLTFPSTLSSSQVTAVANTSSHCCHCPSGCCCLLRLLLLPLRLPPLPPLPLMSSLCSPPHVALSHYCLYGCSSLSSLYVIQEIVDMLCTAL